MQRSGGLWVVLVMSLMATTFVCGTNTPEQELEFLRAKVRQFYPRMAPEKADAFAQAILAIAEKQAFIDLKTTDSGTFFFLINLLFLCYCLLFLVISFLF